MCVRSCETHAAVCVTQAVYAEVGHVVLVRRVPTVATELIGSGVMEWSRERDRYLNVSEGAALAPGPPRGLACLITCLSPLGQIWPGFEDAQGPSASWHT